MAIDLFENEKSDILSKKGKKETVLNDYSGFVSKFEQKKTTDDCYTPPDVYDCVLKYVSEKFDISGYKVMRPFYPGGDYEREEYCSNCIVVDNPPFSIISKIVKFYIERNIKFFLFAPHLTLFSARGDTYTRIVVGTDIVYENGAKVKTSFVSNLFENIAVLSDYTLYKELEKINDSKKVNLPKYKYPNHVLTVSMVQWCLERGVSMKLDKKDIRQIGGLDCQKKHKKAIFGSGYLLSEKAAAEKAAAENAAAEKAAAEKAAAEKDHVEIWELTGREIEIVKSLGIRKR